MSDHPQAFGHTWVEAPEVAWERESLRPRKAKRINWFPILMAIGALLAAGGMATARADNTSFLDTLTDSGIQVYDASQAVKTGWAICEAFEVANGRDIADFVYANSSYADVPDMATAELWVIAAAYNLCPEHIHTDQTARTLA